MCEYCDKFNVIAENNESTVFICEDNLILQDKTSMIFSKALDTVCYQSKWIKINYCPYCKKQLSKVYYPIIKDEIILENENSKLEYHRGQINILELYNKTTSEFSHNAGSMEIDPWTGMNI